MADIVRGEKHRKLGKCIDFSEKLNFSFNRTEVTGNSVCTYFQIVRVLVKYFLEYLKHKYRMQVPLKLLQ